MVWETKGDQLSGNLDTEYKQKLLARVSEAFKIDVNKSAGQVEISFDKGTTLQFELVLMSDWKSRLGAFAS
jgi:type III restriction enzyme